jgi:uncharacterized protein (TIGR00369 family)
MRRAARQQRLDVQPSRQGAVDPAALAAHTAGAAAFTLVDAGQTVLSLEFKVNLLRPALCEQLLCRAEVLKAGKTVTVVEAEVYALVAGEKRLFSKTMVTLAVVPIPS